MITNLEYLHLSHGMITVFILIVVVIEVIKGLSYLWGWIAPKIFNVKTKMSKKKEIENIILSNQEEIKELKSKQDQDRKYSKEGDQKIRQDIEGINTALSRIDDAVLQMRIDSMRNTILDFASSIGSGRTFSKEQYLQIITLHETYDKLITEHGMTNGMVSLSMEIINQSFKDCTLNHGFLEDKINAIREDNLDCTEK